MSYLRLPRYAVTAPMTNGEITNMPYPYVPNKRAPTATEANVNPRPAIEPCAAALHLVNPSSRVSATRKPASEVRGGAKQRIKITGTWTTGAIAAAAIHSLML